MHARTAVILAIVVALLQACSTAPTGGRDSENAWWNVKLLGNLIGAYRATLLSSTKQVCGNADCTVDIEMKIAQTDDGAKYCVARLPVELSFSGSGEKDIVWKIPSVLGGIPLEFDSNVGIHEIKDEGNQIHRYRRLDPQTFTAKNKKDHKKKVEATYLPIILWQAPAGPELCAAADPKIVNY